MIAEWPRNAREVVRVDLTEYNGRKVFSARVWYRDGIELKPSRSGITLAVKHLPALTEAVANALSAARALGIMDEGGE